MFYYLLFRALVDCNTELGKEFILNAFPYEEDKIKALRILATVLYTHIYIHTYTHINTLLHKMCNLG